MEDLSLFSNYRDLLKQRYDYLKATNKNFSARYLAKKAHLGSPSFFQMIVKGERRLSSTIGKRLIKAMGFSPPAAEFIQLNIEMERATKLDDRKALLKRIQSLQSREAQTLSPSHVQILSDPLNVKLYLLAQSVHFSFNIKTIQQLMLPQKVTADILTKRIDLLVSSGLWVRDADGVVRTIAPSVKTGDAQSHDYLAMFHDNLLQLARAAIDRPSEDRIYGSRTFLFDPQRLDDVKSDIEQFRQTLESKYEDLKSPRVYTLQLSFFEL